jgi:NAD(P)-dependent dehydrogenase (short-subunit alcohol dehydrogenase family)
LNVSRVAIVTGAAGGLGRAVAEVLGARGEVVVGVDIDGASLASMTVTTAGEVHTLEADLGRWSECERVVGETIDRHGRVDALVNRAAVLRRTELEEVDATTFADIFDANCRSVFVLSREAMRNMEQRGWGRIVNVTSVGVHVGGYSLTSALYEATKAAVMSFTKTFARYAGPRGILVNAVAPGGMRTPMLTEQTPPDLLALVERDIPLAGSPSPTKSQASSPISQARKIPTRAVRPSMSTAAS